jgi:hypothetical protein
VPAAPRRSQKWYTVFIASATRSGFDQELRGGQEWWDAILGRIRTCGEALALLNRHATSEGFRFSGWDGFSSREILEFIKRNTPDSPASM